LDTLEQISKHYLFPLIAFVIGLLVRTYFYYKAKKNKNLKYTYKSYNLIKDHSSKFSDLNISYKGEEVSNFTVTKLIFWNNGRETINGSDITNVEPLRIEIKKNLKFLEASIIQQNNKASEIKISKSNDGREIFLEFDYLDNLNGGVINIIHTGNSERELNFKGRIKGIKRIVQATIPKAPNHIHYFIPFPIHKDISKKKPNQRRFHYGLSLTINGLLIVVLGFVFYLLNIYEIIEDSNNGFRDPKSMIYLSMFPAGLFILNGIWVMTRRLPDGLDLYEDL